MGGLFAQYLGEFMSDYDREGREGPLGRGGVGAWA
jgi:hypothetical protein